MKIKIIGLTLLTSAIFSTNALAVPISGGFFSGNLVVKPIGSTSKTTTYTGYATCGVGKFKGEAEYRKVVHPTYTSFTVTKYKITRLNGQKGGNKANVNVFGYWRTNGKINSDAKRSADRMKQDGNWHSQTLNVATMNHSNQSYEIQFIFDKSGPDPRCSATVY